MTPLEAIVIAIIEGLTEYLPISSTGHMILASTFFGIEGNEFVKNYMVIIQFGAILSVVFLYWRRFVQSFDIYLKLFVAFLPAAVVGLLAKKWIAQMLESAYVVAITFILGGILLLFVDRWFEKGAKNRLENLNFMNAFKIGMCQCLALIPGTSRSASTIVGAMWQGLDRKAAAEFSFLLAVPTLVAATGYKCLGILPTITSDQIHLLLLGNLISFIVGAITIKAFVGFLSRHPLKSFGVYRIVVGVIILALLISGKELELL